MEMDDNHLVAHLWDQIGGSYVIYKQPLGSRNRNSPADRKDTAIFQKLQIGN